MPQFAEPAKAGAATCKTPADLQSVRAAYYTSKWCEKAAAVRQEIQIPSVRRAVQDLARRFPKEYPGRDSLARLDAFEKDAERLCAAAATRDAEALKALPDLRSRWDALRRELLLASPAIDFEKVLFVRRKGSEGLTQNWQGNDPLHGRGFDNEISSFRIRQPDVAEERIYKPEEPIFVGDVDLHFDGDRMLFSTNGTVCEVRTDGSGFRKVITEVSSYDPCYLPDGRLLFSTPSPVSAGQTTSATSTSVKPTAPASAVSASIRTTTGTRPCWRTAGCSTPAGSTPTRPTTSPGC